MQKNLNLIDKVKHLKKPIFIGAIIFALTQIPAIPTLPSTSGSLLPLKTAHVMAGQVETNFALVDDFFGSVPTDVSKTIVDKQMAFVSSRGAYPASLKIIEKHEQTIKSIARDKGVPEDVAIGISLLENGGSETAKSSAGALGVFQLMPATARSLGLTVNSKTDERLNTAKNIESGITYLAMNYERFGDWGLATWAYHAGEGNVAKALKLYAKANHGITLPGVGDAKTLKAYVEKYDVTIHKLLSDPSVKTLTKKLNDDSAGYPYKVVATANLFKLK